MPFNEGQASASLEAAVAGNFVAERDVTDEEMELFATGSAFVVLYPYLRAMFGQLWRMTGLDVSPLPTITVQEFLAAVEPGSDAEESKTAPKPKRPRKAKKAAARKG